VRRISSYVSDAFRAVPSIRVAVLVSLGGLSHGTGVPLFIPAGVPYIYGIIPLMKLFTRLRIGIRVAWDSFSDVYPGVPMAPGKLHVGLAAAVPGAGRAQTAYYLNKSRNDLS